MADYRSLENKIRDIVARPWTKDPKQVHHKLQQIQKKIIDEEPDMLNSKALGIPDSVVEAAKQINKGKTEVDVNPQYKSDAKEPDDEDDKKKSKKEVKENVPDNWETNSNAARKAVVKKNLKVNRDAVTKEELKGNQHKIDKNKNGKIDAHDFKLLRKEEVEQIDEKVKTTRENPLVTVHDKDGLHTHANLSTANKIFNTKVKHTDVHAGPVKTKDGHETKNNLTFAISKHHASAMKEEVEQIDEKEVVFTGSPKHTSKKAEEHKKMGYKVVSLKKHKSGIFGDNSEKHTYKMAKEEVEQVDEISSDLAQRYRTKALAHTSKVSPDVPSQSPEGQAARRQDRNRSQGKQLSWMKMTGQGMGGKALKVPATRKATAEEVILSDEEQSKLDAIAATFAEDAIQSAQKSAQQKVKAASITAKATVQADKIKDQARKQAQNNSYEPEGEVLESNLAAQIRDAKPSVTGHIEVSVGDKKVKIPHRKAQDFLGSYHAKRTADEKDAHEKAFRKEIGG